MQTHELQVIRILNPFDPKQRRYETMPWDGAKPLAAYFNALEPEYVCSVNGRVIEAEQMATTYLSKDDSLVLCPIPQGGGGSKGILRLVSVIALTYFTAGFGAFAAGSAGLGLTGMSATIAGGLIQAGISMAGSMLINALLPDAKPSNSTPNAPDAIANSPSYGVDGPKNVSAEGVAVPVCYGAFRMGGNLINLYNYNAGNTQYLFMLFNMGEGVVAAIDDILINDQPLSQYVGATADVRVGYPDQTVIPWFTSILSPKNINLKAPADGSYFLHTTDNNCDQTRVDVVFPQGLFAIASTTGNAYACNYDLYIDCRLQGGDGVWHPFTNADGSANLGGFFNQRSALRLSFLSPILGNGTYEIRLSRNVEFNQSNSLFSDVLYIADIVEITHEVVTYKNTALLGVQLVLNDQISGLPKVTALNHGRYVRVWRNGAFVYENSINPAWITYDVMTEPRFGAGINQNRFDFEQWKDWAAYCDANNLTFNGVFDVQGVLWDQVQLIMRCGRAQLVNIGTIYSVAIERPDIERQMFSVANIIQGSFKETWLGMVDRANEINVTYFDRIDDYKQHTVRVYDPAILASGKPARTASITLPGIVDARVAVREGTLQLNINRYILQTCEFDTPYEALGCGVGSLVVVQHDMPQWGYAGRLEAGSTTTSLHIDREMALESGKTYAALVTYDALPISSGLIDSISSLTLNCHNFTGNPRARRLKIVGGVEVGITAVSPNSSLVDVDSVAGIAPGQTYIIYETDAMVERTITAGTSGFLKTLPLSTGLPAAPDQYSKFMFGEYGKYKKPFRVKQVQFDGQNFHLVCVEYNESVYDLSGVAHATINYSDLVVGVKHAIIDAVTEQLVLSAGTLLNRVTVAFRGNQDTYKDSAVGVSINSAPIEWLGYNSTQASLLAADNDNLVFTVVARDFHNKPAAIQTAPTISYTVQGKQVPPADVTNFAVTVQPTQIVLTWNEIADLDRDHYEVRRGDALSTWDSATSIYSGTTLSCSDIARGAGIIKYFIKAYDTTGHPSVNATLATLNINGIFEPSGLIASIQSTDLVLTWQAPATQFAIDHYEIRYGATWDTATLIGTTYATHFSMPVNWTGTRKFLVAAVDKAGQVGVAAFQTVNANAPDSPTVTSSLAGTDFKLVWTTPASSLPIVDYEIRFGSSYAGGTSIGRVKGTVYQGPVTWAGDRTFWIVAFDTSGNQGAAVNTTIAILMPNAVDITSQIVDNNVLLSWNDAARSLPIDHYEISKGDTYAGSLPIGTVGGRFSALFESNAGTYSYWVVPVDSAGNHGPQSGVTATVNQPPDYKLFDNYDSRLDSTHATNVARLSPQFAISLNGSTQYGHIASIPDLDSGVTGFTYEQWIMPSTYWITRKHAIFEKTIGGTLNTSMLMFIDNGLLFMRVVIGGVLKSASYDVSLLADKQPIKVCGRWDGTNVKLAINGVNVASTAASGTLSQGAGEFRMGQLGTGGSAWSFQGMMGPARMYKRALSDSEVLEHYRDIYKVETSLIAAYNVDEGSGVTLYDDTDNAYDLTFLSTPTWQRHELDGRADRSITTSCAYYPVNPNKTFAEHFTDAGVTSMGGMITAGHTHGLTPAPNSAQYVEVIDYGVVIPGSKVFLTLTDQGILGSATITPTISVKKLITDAWTDFVGTYSVFGLEFQFVKVTLDVTSAGGNHLRKLSNMNLNLNVKVLNDSGNVVCAATDVGGTPVSFNTPFLDVDMILVTPLATTPVIATYDFVDAPSPTGFKVLLFDRATGARVSATASWHARGV